MTDAVLSFEPALFRQILGHLPTGVTVVTTLDENRPLGLAVGSFFSVSLEPPLVGFCAMTTSSTWLAIERTSHFAVSLLADDQADVCLRLATEAPDKFDGLSWSPAPLTGSPLFDGAIAHFDCKLEQKHLAGDHWIVVGRVGYLALHRDEAGPLLFYQGGYGRHQTI